ncbi:hypothetical protein H4S03_003909 [Coemansia sp. S3946]|nr:hypothetical protein H4S03_003909 [Coemansia sp. S3946]KAJ2425387.1 hypothetical protein GGF41_002442 [Coemansia sp. RSA 2531]
MPDRDTALLVIEKLKNIRLVNAPGPLQPRIADSEGQKQLKKQINGEGGRFDDSGVIRSGATSPIVWSPVLVYSPAGSPPPHSPHGFDMLPAQRQMSTSPSEQRYVGAMPIHHLQQASYSATPGMYAIPSPYPGYPSSGYASPVGYGSPVGFSSPMGYASPNGYASPQIPSSPQLAYTHQMEHHQQMPYGVYRVQNSGMDMTQQTMAHANHYGDYEEDVAEQLSQTLPRAGNAHEHRRRQHQHSFSHGRPAATNAGYRGTRTTDSSTHHDSAAERSAKDLTNAMQEKLAI